MLKKWPSYLVHNMRTRIRWAFFVAAFLSASLGFAATPVLQAHAQDASISNSFSQVAQFGNTPGSTSGYGSNTSSCEIETVGWVICPVMRSIAKLADYGFAFINQNFLKIEYGISNSDSGVYKAWEIMRNVANALFVLAFMGIVYAQISGKSAGGYSIKRMLPRLIIGAIFVNVSFYVCVIAIELSNVIGGSILAIMQGVTDQIGPAAMTLSSAQNGFDDSRLSDITSAILTKSGTVWILLAPVAAVTISIALICAAGLVLLIVRKVVVAMLVLVSPLMFVTYLLPNTEHYFQQWIRLFFQMLLLYPVIAFLLGTGQIISATIINVGSESDSNYRVRDDSYNARNGGSGSSTTDLAAAGAAVLPLLGTWFLMKSLSSFATTAGTKVAGNISRRGSKKEEQKIKAQLDGKAKQAVAGSGLPTYDRKPAFSRLRRRRGTTAIADNLPLAQNNKATPKPAGTTGQPGAATPSLFDRAIGNVNKQPGEPEAADLDNDIALGTLDSAQQAKNSEIAAALTGTGKDDDKKKTAKDLLDDLNKPHQANDKKVPQGGEKTDESTAPQAGPSAPLTTPTTPYMATEPGAANSAAPVASVTQQIIAVPTAAIDAAAFVKKDESSPAPTNSLTHPPTTEIEKKAKERANKYLFKAQNDIDDASDRLEELNEIRLNQQKEDEKHKDTF